MKVPGTTQCVGIYPGSDKTTTRIVTDRLADCMSLQHEHIQLHGQCHLSVFLNSVQKQEADEVSTCGQTTEGWQKALTHLLETFKPAKLYVEVDRTEFGKQKDRFHMSLQDGSLYWCRWSYIDNKLAMTR